MLRLAIANRVPRLAPVVIQRGIVRRRSRGTVRVWLRLLIVIRRSVIRRVCEGQRGWLVVQR